MFHYIQKRIAFSNEESEIETPSAVKEEKPKKEKTKKKKEIKVIERPTLYKYTLSGNVKNSEGRFRFTDIVEAQDVETATSIFKQRAKKEFSGFRTINKIECNTYKEGDEKSINKIEEIVSPLVTKTEVDEDDLNSTQKNLIKDFKDIVGENGGDVPCFKIIYTPGRKPRKRDYDKNFIMVDSDTLSDAKIRAKNIVEGMGLPWKEKWAVFIKGTLNDFKESIIKRIRDCKYDEDDFCGFNFSETNLPNIVTVESKKINKNKNLKGYSVTFSDDHYIEELNPDGLTIVDLVKLKWFTVELGNNDKFLPAIRVPSESPESASASALYIIHEYEYKSLYSGCTCLRVTDENSKKTVKIEISDITKLTVGI